MITKSWLMDLFEGTSNFRFYSNRIFRRNLPDEPFRLWQGALPKLCRSFPGASPSKHFTSQFFKYNSSCCHGQYFWSESSKVKQQWKICHKFQGWIMQDLPHLNNLYTTGIRKGTLHCTIITAGLKKWKVNRPLGDWIPDLALHNWDYKLTIFTFYCTNITLALEPRFRGEDSKSSQLIFGFKSSYAVHLPISLYAT